MDFVIPGLFVAGRAASRVRAGRGRLATLLSPSSLTRENPMFETFQK
jgi:hypothetical protein